MRLQILLFTFVVLGVLAASPEIYAQSIYGGGPGDGFSTASVAQPDDPLYNIYNGGNADGFSTNSVAQPDNPLVDIYKGGTDDGFAVSSVAQPDNVLFDIYKGGTDDGFAFSSVAQPDNVLYDIYKGGTEDGFAFSSVAQPDNVLYDIYKGGTDDGFSLSSFAQPDNVLYDIYKGGIGDGFSFTSLGSPPNEVALPIELLYFRGYYKGGSVMLEWETATEKNNLYFSVERSSNGIAFSETDRQSGAGTSVNNIKYYSKDSRPLPGVSYYRLLQVDVDGTPHQSKLISVKAPDDLGEPFVIYPNPVSDKFTLQARNLEPAQTADVEVRNVYGVSVGNFTFEAGASGEFTATISVADYSPGTYVVRILSGVESRTIKVVVVR